jgi:hypothetical protein
MKMKLKGTRGNHNIAASKAFLKQKYEKRNRRYILKRFLIIELHLNHWAQANFYHPESFL